jgi:hypothetical protein
MGFLRHTVGMSRADLMRDCLQQIRVWPGCETVEEIGVLAEPRGGFSVHVVKYGSAKKRLPTARSAAFAARSCAAII